MAAEPVLEEEPVNVIEEVEEEEVEAVELERVRGRVVSYFNRKGFGFLSVLNDDETKLENADESKVFVHWKAISSSDRWPQLSPESEVEFSISEKDGRKYAENVTAVGGGELNNESKEEEKVVTESTSNGKVKFYDSRKGFGFIELLEDCEVDGETLEKGADIHVGRESILSNDPCPSLRPGMTVKFNISRTDKGLTCLDVVDSEGNRVTVPEEKRRKRKKWNRRQGGGRGRNRTYPTQVLLPQIGTLVKWNEKKGFGWIQPNEDLSIHGVDLQENDGNVYVHRNDINGKVKEGCSVCFSLFFARNRGISASNVQQVDPSTTSSMNGNSENAENAYGTYIPSVLSLLVEESHIPKIIGKKGSNIRKINQSSGAVVQVVELEEHFGNKRLVNTTGYAPGIKKATLAIFEKLYGNKSDEKSRITFLFHDIQSMMGRLIGKNGSNINNLRRITDLTVTVANTLPLQGQPMSSLKLEGPYEAVEEGINMSVDMLVKLYHDTVLEYFNGYQQFYYNHLQFNM